MEKPLVLSEPGWAKLMGLRENPPEPTEALKKLLEEAPVEVPMTEKLTREDFLKGVKDMITEAADPDSDISTFQSDIEGIKVLLQEHDQVLAEKLDSLLTSFLGVRDYIIETYKDV